MEEQIQQTTKQVLVGAGHLLAFLSQQGVPMKPLPNPPTLLQSQMDKSVAGFNSALDHMSVNIESALEFLELEKHRLGLVQNEKVKTESEPEVTVKTEPAETEDSKEFTIDGMDASHAIDLDGAFDDFGSNDVDINAMLGDGKDGNKDGIMMDDELSNLLADGENGGGNNAGNTTGIADDDMEGLFGDGFDFVSYDQ
ncbi:hypothetical protein B0I72DRAFT_29919 [Yarrowia lipolytica]|jgi:hypothetical protein|uniref:Uncharacterized protein n=1 Tax=Yarrowia lipolytica TaxID=4952 RepID=A0A1D8NFM3_YARLL|nr:hypothetical protein YALI1_D27844g [Yarrowia lipolytica]KAB8285741.1 hypothetical protein BKA91DRAFT_29873 [Yarrowia lipolytica]KAE8172362.1 hypothetical protein BKA90DRAFT_18379 [Yarrowia lipolytica]KAJ8054082.1 hypothetical protein LXG23DRAFT_55653 [Yarrowia lipolytica]RDW26156.1 hypothetical protein B0I71DRAFT_34903 [Yarrowia lipolytica]